MQPLSSHRGIAGAVLPLVILVALLCVPGAALAQDVPSDVAAAVHGIERAAGARPTMAVSRLTGLVTFMATPAAPIPSSLGASAHPEARARAFLATHGPAFGISSMGDVAHFRSHGPDLVGTEHVRFRQMHGGLPVTGGELTVHLRGGDVVAVNAKTLDIAESIITTPAISAADAETLARALVVKHAGITDATFSAPRLEIFNRGMLAGHRAPTRLAWFIEAIRIDYRQFIWIDAHTGMRLLDFSQLTDARDRRIFNADGGNILPGRLVRSEGQGPTNDNDTNKAYDFSGNTYDYYLNEHGRDSYDDAGAQIISTVHFCPNGTGCTFQNAFWNGTQMVYGNGFAAADDVDAHELTHAVTEHSAGLFYYMQSGALNESYSDIFGETVDLLNGAGTDTPAVRWLLGEDIPGIGAIRDMMNPNRFFNPGRMSDFQFFSCEDDPAREDRGGVHTNSGVPNHAYALMVDGGTYNGFTISGIGLIKAGKIQYRALTTYLVSASDFLDNYNALKQSCQDLVGVAGITNADCVEVGKALDAVEMAATWPCLPQQAAVPDLCPAGQRPSHLFFDDFENTASGHWTVTSLTGTTHWFYPPPADFVFATSGVQNLWGYDSFQRGDSAIGMTRSITIPAGGARLQFNHSYGFESSPGTNFDGGVIEYSTNDGASWSDAGSLIVAGATYGGFIHPCCGNPLANRSAFVQDSFGYTASQLDLTSLAGQNVRFRFRIGTDVDVDDFGWFIDDVAIYQCVATIAPPTISKRFGAATLLVGATTSLAFTVNNPNATATLTGIGVIDPLPAGLVIATPDGLNGGCGDGTITASPGETTISLSGATLAGGASCTFAVNVTGTAAGVKTNTTGNVTSVEGGAGGSASASVTVTTPAPPTINKSFGASPLLLGATTSLTFTVGNPSATTTLTGIGVSDNLPSGLVVATPAALTGSCPDGTITALPGATTVSLSGATLASGASCTFGVNVVGTTVGVKTNTTGNVTSNEGGTGGVATASVTVVPPAPPTIQKSFGAAAFLVGTTTTLTFTLANPNPTTLSGIGFTDTLPSGLVLATPDGLTGDCGGGTITVLGSTVSLSGATLGAGASCTFSVNVVAIAVGPKTNITGNVTSVEGGTGGTATAAVNVTVPDATFRFSVSAFSVSETSATATITVVRAGPRLTAGATVELRTVAGGTATADTHYTPVLRTLTFGAGQTTMTTTVPIIDNTVVDGSRTVNLALLNPSPGTQLGTPNTAVLTITDNDAGGVVQFGAATYRVNESPGGVFNITVVRAGTNLASEVFVDYAATGGTATPIDDYVLNNGTVTFSAGQTSAVIPVTIINDGLPERDETVIVTLSNARGGATLGTIRTTTLTIVDDEQAIQFSSPTYTVTEATAMAAIGLTRSGPATGTLTVICRTVPGGNAQPGKDYQDVERLLTFAANVRMQTCLVPIINNTLADANVPRTVNLELAEPPAASGGVRAVLGTTTRAVLTITDNDQGGVIRFAVAAQSVVEGQTAKVLVNRTGTNLARGVTVEYAVTGGTATNGGVDFDLANGTLTFGAGQAVATISAPTVNDTLAEGPETIVITLSNPNGGATLGTPAITTLTIADNDNPGTIQFGAASYSVAENVAGGVFNLTVTRTGANLASGITVDYAVTGGTATNGAGADYVLGDGTVTFAAGQTSAQIPVQINDDGDPEGNETVVVTLSNPSGGATLGAIRVTTLTILDDEQALSFTSPTYTVTEGTPMASIGVTRSGLAAGTVTVICRAVPGGTAVAGQDYQDVPRTLTFAVNVRLQTCMVPILNATLVDGPRTVNLQLDTPGGGALLGTTRTAVLTINDNDQGGVIRFALAAQSVIEGQTAKVLVNRVGTNLASGVTVVYAVTGGNATNGGVDYTLDNGTLTFAAGQTSATIPVPTVNDTLAEGPETVIITLSNPIGGATLGTPASTTLTITDNDNPGTIQFGAASYSVNENVAGGVFNLTLTRTGANLASGITMDYAVTGGTATPDVDYVLPNGAVTFAAGQTSAQIPVQINNDDDPEGNETVIVTLSNPSGGARLGPIRTTTLTIVDDEQALTFSAAAYTVAEGTRTMAIPILRSGPTPGGTTVTCQSVDVGGGSATPDADYRPVNTTLTFAAGVRMVNCMVPILDDAVIDGAKTVNLALSVPPGSSGLLGSPSAAVLTINDNDQVGTFRFGSATYMVDEGATGTLTVMRAGTNLASGVTVDYTVTGGTAANGTDYSLADGTITFNAGQTSATIPVPTFTDGVFDGNQTVIVTLSNPTAGGSIGTPATTTLTIRDTTRQVRFLNNLVICDPSCQPFTAPHG
jgi:bacillolysin